MKAEKLMTAIFIPNERFKGRGFLDTDLREEVKGHKLADVLSEAILSVSGTMSSEKFAERAKRLLELRFGLEDGSCRTLKEMSNEFGISQARIRQIEVKALRKLRHPSRSKKLEPFIITEQVKP